MVNWTAKSATWWQVLFFCYLYQSPAFWPRLDDLLLLLLLLLAPYAHSINFSSIQVHYSLYSRYRLISWEIKPTYSAVNTTVRANFFVSVSPFYPTERSCSDIYGTSAHHKRLVMDCNYRQGVGQFSYRHRLEVVVLERPYNLSWQISTLF